MGQKTFERTMSTVYSHHLLLASSSAAEPTTVNRLVAGSIPASPANIALVAQLAERLICNQDVGSSILLGGTIFGGLAHLVEQLLCKQQAIGSNPITSTILCSVNSDGRVSALHAECRRFDPVTEYQFCHS